MNVSKIQRLLKDQCASYQWLDPSRHQFCLAHVLRILQQMVDYASGGLTAHIGAKLVRLCQSIFRTQHRFELHELEESRWRNIQHWQHKGTQVPASRYAGGCKHILKHGQGLWVFMAYPGTPLTNNEAERCLRDSVILRKICFGTSSHRGELFRSRVLSVVETCKKHGLSVLDVISEIVAASSMYRLFFGLITLLL